MSKDKAHNVFFLKLLLHLQSKDYKTEPSYERKL